MTNVAAWLVVAFAAVALVALARGRAGVEGTTLVGAWYWALAAVVAVSGVALAELAQGGEANGQFAPLRFAAAGLTLCPVVAVLGAKRPQDRAWHWVVLSLWMVVCIPAVNSAFFHPGGGVELHAAQGGFVTALVLLGIANYLPTRHAPFALLTGLSQLLLFSEQLSFSLSSPLVLEGGVVIYAVGVAVSPFARRARPTGGSLDAAWLDFRDRFGSLWALRVLTRFNAAADANHWPARIAWSGFRPRAAETAAEQTTFETIPAVRRCFHSLLRRFV